MLSHKINNVFLKRPWQIFKKRLRRNNEDVDFEDKLPITKENSFLGQKRKKMRREIYKNDFKLKEIYNCGGCNKPMLGKDMHRHIDECKNSLFEKDFCEFCKRECVKRINYQGYIVHVHKCRRPMKINRKRKIAHKKKRKIKKQTLYYHFRRETKFNLFKTAHILHTENILRKKYSRLIKLTLAVGNYNELINLDYKIVGEALFAHGLEDIKNYFLCVGYYKAFFIGNVNHLTRQSTMKFTPYDKSLYKEQYNGLSEHLKYLPEI